MLRLLAALANPLRVDDLLQMLDEPRRSAVLEFIRRCHDNQFLTRVDEQGRADEEQDCRAHWEFHDLLFHTHSRIGRNPAPVGGTYRFGGVLAPEPALKCRLGESAETAIPLARADVNRLKETDIPFTKVLEERRSVRSAEPLGIDALGEFLYRSCRVTPLSQTEGAEDLVRSVYPSGGSLHPLEVYIAATACPGLGAGMYRYQRLEHVLYTVAGFTSEVEALLEDARRSAGGLPGHPPILFVITARFRRTMWKYQSIAYRLILQEVGALYQTMYLVATAMGLSPCALGVGDSDRFARVASLDYYRETSVGEFMLGGSEPDQRRGEHVLVGADPEAKIPSGNA